MKEWTTDDTIVARARWAISAVFLVCGTGMGLWATHIPMVQTRFALTEGTLGLVLLTVAAGAVIGMPVAGWLPSRFGSRPTNWIAGGTYIVALCLPLFASSPALLFAAVFLFGICNGALDVIMNVHGSEVERAFRRPIMSSLHGFFSLGGLLGATAGGGLIGMGLGDGRGIALMAAALALILVVVGPRLLPSAPVPRGARGGWPRPVLLTLSLYVLLVMLIEGAVTDWSAVHLTTNLGATASFAAIGYAAFSIAIALSRFVGDAIVARLGARVIMVGGGIIMAAGMMLAATAVSPVVASVGFALVGLGAANVIPVVFVAATRVEGVAPGIGVATASSIGFAGFMLGPPVIGVFADEFGLAAALGVLALGGLALALAPITHPSLIGPGRSRRQIDQVLARPISPTCQSDTSASR